MKRDWKTFVRDDYKKLVDTEKKGDAARKAKDYRKAAKYYGAAAKLSVGQHNIQRFRKLVLTMKKQSSARTEGTMKTTDDFLEAKAQHDMVLLTQSGRFITMKFLPGESNYVYTKTKHKQYKRIAHPKSVKPKEALAKFHAEFGR